jgi:teichuronic acid biosynthesis glycosyltransferase TuaG
MEEGKYMISYTAYEVIDEDGNKTGLIHKVPKEISYNGLLKFNVLGCSTVVIKREYALKYPMSEEFFHEDYTTWLSITRECGKAGGISKELVQYRLMKGSKSRNKLNSTRKVWHIYRYYLKFNLLKSAWYFTGYTWAGRRSC